MPQIDSPAPDGRCSASASRSRSPAARPMPRTARCGQPQLTWRCQPPRHAHASVPAAHERERHPDPGARARGPRLDDHSYLEIRLTATDSTGLSRTISRTSGRSSSTSPSRPIPPGLHIDVNEVEMTGPQTVTSWEAWQLTLDAQDRRMPQASSGGSTRGATEARPRTRSRRRRRRPRTRPSSRTDIRARRGLRRSSPCSDYPPSRPARRPIACTAHPLPTILQRPGADLTKRLTVGTPDANGTASTSSAWCAST